MLKKKNGICKYISSHTICMEDTHNGTKEGSYILNLYIFYKQISQQKKSYTYILCIKKFAPSTVVCVIICWTSQQQRIQFPRERSKKIIYILKIYIYLIIIMMMQFVKSTASHLSRSYPYLRSARKNKYIYKFLLFATK